MVGSAQSISGPSIVLNTVLAEVLSNMADELEGAENFKAKLSEILERLVKEHHRIIFNGDGYSDEWVEIAESRGLPNVKSTPEAIAEFTRPEYIEVFEKHGVFSAGEVHARQEIVFEEYAKVINIEALTAIDMARKEILPAVMEYITSLADSINSIKSAVPTATVAPQAALVEKLSALVADATEKLAVLEAKVQETQAIEDIHEQAMAFKFVVFEAMQDLRKPCDEMETLTAEEFWPFPTYMDLLFRV